MSGHQGQDSFWSEEDVRAKIVTPWLRELGFDDSELSLETGLTIPLPHGTFRVDTGKEVGQARVRWDILVSRGGRNLFVVEVKRPQVELTEADVKQAAVYARVVEPPAPYAVITNGVDWRIHDSVTRARIDHLTADGPFEIVLSDEARTEAIMHFLGFSKRNLLEYCAQQVAYSLRPLKGSATLRDRTYIPDLYEPDTDADSALRRFLASDNRCFAVLGASGSGKTCWLCRAAEATATECPSLFLRSHKVKDGILTAVSEDLNWSLSPYLSGTEGARRFFQVFRDERVLVFLDGLDEISPADAIRVLDEFLSRTRNRDVRLILACKTLRWADLLERQGVPTVLGEVVSGHGQECVHRMGTYNPKRFHAMLRRYREFYRVPGLRLERGALEDAKRSPFVLRLLFETSSGSGQDVAARSLQLFERYTEAIAKRSRSREMTERMLLSVAALCYRLNRDTVDAEQLRKVLGLGAAEILPPDLFDQNVLERYQDGLHATVRFYFSWLRDFIIARDVLQLPRLSVAAFTDLVRQKEWVGVHLEVLESYYAQASSDHKRAIDSPLFENASSYLESYREIVDKHFAAFRLHLPPRSQSPMGFGATIDLRTASLTMYGFRRVRRGQSEVEFVPGRGWSGSADQLLSLLAVDAPHSDSSADGFRNLNIRLEVLTGEVAPALREVLRYGLLDQSLCPALTKERLLATYLSHCRHYIRAKRALVVVDSGKTRFPWQLDVLMEGVCYERAVHVYEDELRDDKLRRGEIHEEWSGDHVRMSCSFTNAEMDTIHERAMATARRGELLGGPRRRMPLPSEEEVILADLATMRSLGVTAIQYEPYLLGFEEYRVLEARLRDERQARSAVEGLFATYLTEYAALVRSNFPTLAEHFLLLQHLPLRVGIEAGANRFTTDDGLGGCTVTLSEEQSDETIRTIDAGRRVWSTGRGFSYSAFSSTMEPHMPFQIRGGCPLRTLVYESLCEDMEVAFGALCQQYGVAPVSDRQRWRVRFR